MNRISIGEDIIAETNTAKYAKTCVVTPDSHAEICQ